MIDNKLAAMRISGDSFIANTMHMLYNECVKVCKAKIKQGTFDDLDNLKYEAIKALYTEVEDIGLRELSNIAFMLFGCEQGERLLDIEFKRRNFDNEYSTLGRLLNV